VTRAEATTGPARIRVAAIEPADGIDVLQALGEALSVAWRDANYDDEAFADLATAHLRDTLAAGTPGLRDLTEWIVTSRDLPRQERRSFGQPPVNVYTGHKFLIEVIVWLDSTTAIHQHGFSGAFGVLEGSSVHSRYRFELQDRVCTEVLLGDVEFESAELLNRGDVHTIRAGPEFLHSLFHLERPSVSVVVRTTSEPRYNPQYSYLKPGLAIDPFHDPEPLATTLELLESLTDVNPELFWSASRTLVRTSDFWTALRVVGLAVRTLHEAPELEELLAEARVRHGERISYVIAAAEEQRRQANITARRQVIRDPDFRYFLALLLNVPDRRTIYDLIADRYPRRNPEALVLRWVAELSEQRRIGLEFDALSLKLLEFALRDVPFEDVRGALEEAFGLDPKQQVELRALWDELHSALLLRPLFEADQRTRVVA